MQFQFLQLQLLLSLLVVAAFPTGPSLIFMAAIWITTLFSLWYSRRMAAAGVLR